MPKEITRNDLQNKSALCLIPPENIWESIQEIRKIHDRAVNRWMPHINILYPYVEVEQFKSQLKYLNESLTKIKSFQVTLKHFNYFDRKIDKNSSTDPELVVFLEPQDDNHNLQQLYNILIQLYPICHSKKK